MSSVTCVSSADAGELGSQEEYGAGGAAQKRDAVWAEEPAAGDPQRQGGRETVQQGKTIPDWIDSLSLLLVAPLFLYIFFKDIELLREEKKNLDQDVDRLKA